MTDMLETSIKEAIRRTAASEGVDVTFGGPDDPCREDAMHVNLHVAARSPTRFVSVSRHPMHDEGSEGTMITFVAADAPLHPRDERVVAAFVADGARVRRREMAILDHVCSGLAPAWSYVMHRLALLFVSHSARGLPLTFVPVPDNLVKVNRKRGRRTDLSTGRALTVPLGDFLGRYGRNVVEARADRIFVHDLEIGRRPDNSPLAVFRDQAAPELLVTGLQLPQTALAGMVGMDVAEAVSHPALGTHAGIPIESAVNDETVGGVVLRLPLVLEPAGPAPKGVDASWRLA